MRRETNYLNIWDYIGYMLEYSHDGVDYESLIVLQSCYLDNDCLYTALLF